MGNLPNSGTLNQERSEEKKVAVNTIQRTALVERMCVDKYRIYYKDDIIPYDLDNLYPNKVKAIAQRSGSTISAIKKLSEFTSGEGFSGMDQPVNRKGKTLWSVLQFISFQRAMFGGWALHFNFNIFGEITEIQPVPFEFVRWSKDEKELVVNPDWGRKRRYRVKEKKYCPYKPDNVLKEIEECGGIENYQGQILYFIEEDQDIYTLTRWDAVLDDAQLEAEIKLFNLSCIQNNYSLSGLFVLPKTIESTDEGKELTKELRKDIGAGNAGGLRLITVLPTDELRGWKWFQSIERNNIDNLFENQKESAKFNIYHNFNQPPVLSGVVEEGMFNQDTYTQAFEYYNSATETDRKDIEKELNKIISRSIWSDIGPIQIIPKSYIKKQSNGEVIDQ